MSKPTKPGFYWFRQHSSAPPRLIEIGKFGGELVSVSHHGEGVADVQGEFAGPLDGPNEKKSR